MKKRTISSIIVIAILVPIILIGGYLFALVAGALGVWAYKEILDLKKSHKNIPNLIKVFGLLSIIYLILGNYGINSLDFAVSYSRILLPFLLILLPTVFYSEKKYTTNDAIYILGMVYLIGYFFNLVIVIRNIDINLLWYLLSLTVFTDTFAYTIGSLIGKNKMSPKISPNKSWEGFFAGLIGGSIISTIVYSNLIGNFSFKILLISIILSIIGQIGDLVFSKIKRENGIKDFSNIMPGHGGVLDRLDSLLFVVFTYVLVINLL